MLGHIMGWNMPFFKLFSFNNLFMELTIFWKFGSVVCTFSYFVKGPWLTVLGNQVTCITYAKLTKHEETILSKFDKESNRVQPRKPGKNSYVILCILCRLLNKGLYYKKGIHNIQTISLAWLPLLKSRNVYIALNPRQKVATESVHDWSLDYPIFKCFIVLFNQTFAPNSSNTHRKHCLVRRSRVFPQHGLAILFPP